MTLPPSEMLVKLAVKETMTGGVARVVSSVEMVMVLELAVKELMVGPASVTPPQADRNSKSKIMAKKLKYFLKFLPSS